MEDGYQPDALILTPNEYGRIFGRPLWVQ